MWNNNIFDVNMTFLSSQPKDTQSTDSEEGEEIIRHVGYCLRSDKDKELLMILWHWTLNIFLTALSDSTVQACGREAVTCWES